MTIHGLPSPIHDPRANKLDDRAGNVRDQQPGAAQPSTVRTPRHTAPGDVAPTRPAARPAASVPAEAPAGTDPQLWSVLTSDERAFFAKASAQGPLTYTNLVTKQAPSAPAAMPRGSRMDVRV